MNNKTLLSALCLWMYASGIAQVGINNTDPNAVLDVRASNQATPTATDGILIPKINNFPTPDPGAEQDGMLVYATGSGTPEKGFYYWNNDTDEWVAVNLPDADWYQVGSTSAPLNIADNIFREGNVAIGKNTANFKLDVEETGSALNGININYQAAIPAGQIGTVATFTDNSTGGALHQGIYLEMNQTSTALNYGITSRLQNNNSPLQFGVFSWVGSGSGSNSAFQGRVTGTGTNDGASIIIFPSGSASTEMQVGYGAQFRQPTTNQTFGLYNQFQSDANVAADTGSKYGVYNRFGSGGADYQRVGGSLYGLYNDFYFGLTSATDKYGSYTDIPASVGGTHYGTYNSVGVNNGWAGYFVGKNYISERLSIASTDNANAKLSITANTTSTTVSHIELIETISNGGAKVRFSNSAEPTNHWTLFGRADDTDADSRFTINYNTTEVIRVSGNGRVGIMRAPGTNALEVEGEASKSSGGDWVTNSDERLKKNIETITSQDALNKILSLRGVTYEWNDDKTGTKRPEGIQYGFIAQEIADVFPEKVMEDNLGYLQTAYGTYDPLYVQAIKELNKKIESLEKENNTLQKQIELLENIEKRLLRLEQKENEVFSAVKE